METGATFGAGALRVGWACRGDTDGLQYAYDVAGRLTQLTDYDASHLDYAYDAAGNVTSMNDYHGNTTLYTYTALNQVSAAEAQLRLRRILRIRTVTAPGAKTWTYAYNALDQATSVSIPNGMTTAYGYDTRNRLAAIEHKDGGTVLDGFTYAFDDAGNITTITHEDDAYWGYEYDGRDRLTRAERYDTDGSTLLHRYAYTYDAGDNMVTKTVFDGTNTATYAMAYNDANELTAQAVGGVTTDFAYDEWGRMTSKSISGSYSATYAYRYGDKLYSVTSDFPNEGTVTYEYGGDQKRRSRSVSGGAYTWYNWDIGWNVINEENSIGSLAMTYAMDDPNAEVAAILSDVAGTNPSAGTYRYYAHDHLGSTRALRAENKSSLGAYEYSPYGQQYAQSGVAMSALGGSFTGKPWDATAQLYYFPYRYYSPDAARWLTRDPLGMVDGPNLYAYTNGGPIDRYDPLGLDFQICYEERWYCMEACEETWCCGDCSDLNVFEKVGLMLCLAECQALFLSCMSIEGLDLALSRLC
ncbi:MAG: RHS repeat-associated core domain-containing protein [Candidatus Hydrogenedentes bacterium]|nr:RHS repeat-associated core domain-containing protein [Candidatus Hydrogenedentota bacterium]